MGTDRPRPTVTRLNLALPPVAVLALAVGYLGVDMVEGLSEHGSGIVSPAGYAGLIAVQALCLVFRRSAPVMVFCAVVLIDAILLGTSGGEFANGSLAVMIATYALTRTGDVRIRYPAVIAGSVVTTMAGAVALVVAAKFPLPLIFAAVVARAVLQYLVPAGVAEFALARERLVRALRDRAELAERERANGVEREIASVRRAMARELHDIAAHHLSGIIVGAQAASALVDTDPDRTREMLRTVQLDARTTLMDLRRTVGLLHGPDDSGPTTAARPTPIPTLARIADLVDAARGRGQHVTFTVAGDPVMPGPLAETAAYRMVQESLANAARHAPGASAGVHIDYGPDRLSVVVENEFSAAERTAIGRADRGYGMAGMQERADLVGALLTTGPTPSGGWRNALDLPVNGREVES